MSFLSRGGLGLLPPSPAEMDVLFEASRNRKPTFPAPGVFNEFHESAHVGDGQIAFESGADALRKWRMHMLLGLRVRPVPLQVGETVVLSARALGVWPRFACRISELVDRDREFGFTYQTLPGHPEQGCESFVLRLRDDNKLFFTVSGK